MTILNMALYDDSQPVRNTLGRYKKRLEDEYMRGVLTADECQEMWDARNYVEWGEFARLVEIEPRIPYESKHA